MTLLLLLACARHPAPVETPVTTPETTDAAAGISDPALRTLLTEHWNDTMRRWPTWATAVGDHRFDDRLPATGPAATADAIAARDGFLARALAIAPATLPASDRLTLALFVEKLETDAATDICRTEQWGLSARTSPVVDLNNLADAAAIETPAHARAYVARLRGAGPYVDGVMANLRAGIASGRTPAIGSARLVLEQVRTQLALPDADWQLATPAKVPHPDWSPADQAVLGAELTAAIGDVRRAYEGFATFLDAELLPAARPEEKAGTLYLPDGAACYTALIRSETSLSRTPDDVHQTGLDALRDIHAEMVDLGNKSLGTQDLPTLLARLRADRTLYFEAAPDIQARAEDALARATAAIPRFFGRLPQAPCTVVPIPDYEAPYTYIAYYNPAVPGGRGGEYRINLSRPETRARFEMEALTWHESIPGHHLQIAIAQELPEMPAFRKHLGTTAYVEGWALYTERLADEMGLYTDDVDRLGMLSFDAWRASRLVVDTGIHGKGWTREQAVQFMLANTALAENNIRNEVDRYVTWPGQATAYKIGQLEMWALRRDAEARLGPRFDLKAFHDVVLGQGAVTLPVLRAQVDAWIQSVP